MANPNGASGFTPGAPPWRRNQLMQTRSTNTPAQTPETTPPTPSQPRPQRRSRRRWQRYRVALPLRVQRSLILHLPALRLWTQEYRWRTAWAVVNRAMAAGLSQNVAARVAGVPASWVSKMRSRLASEGQAAFRGARNRCGRRRRPGSLSPRTSGHAYLQVCVAEPMPQDRV